MKPKLDIKRDGLSAYIDCMQRDGIHVVPRTEEAAVAFANVLHLAHLEHPVAFGKGYRAYSRTDMEDLVYNPQVTNLGYIHNGFLTGGLSMAINERLKDVRLCYLYRLERAKGLGIGRKLMIAAVDLILDAGVDRAFLDVITINKHARSVYHELGFKELSSYSSARGFKFITMFIAGEDRIKQARDKMLEQS